MPGEKASSIVPGSFELDGVSTVDLVKKYVGDPIEEHLRVKLGQFFAKALQVSLT